MHSEYSRLDFILSMWPHPIGWRPKENNTSFPWQERILQKMTLGFYLQQQLFFPLQQMAFGLDVEQWHPCSSACWPTLQTSYLPANPGKYPLTYITAVSFHFVHLPVTDTQREVSGMLRPNTACGGDLRKVWGVSQGSPFLWKNLLETAWVGSQLDGISGNHLNSDGQVDGNSDMPALWGRA